MKRQQEDSCIVMFWIYNVDLGLELCRSRFLFIPWCLGGIMWHLRSPSALWDWFPPCVCVYGNQFPRLLSTLLPMWEMPPHLHCGIDDHRYVCAASQWYGRMRFISRLLGMLPIMHRGGENHDRCWYFTGQCNLGRLECVKYIAKKNHSCNLVWYIKMFLNRTGSVLSWIF